VAVSSRGRQAALRLLGFRCAGEFFKHSPTSTHSRWPDYLQSYCHTCIHAPCRKPCLPFPSSSSSPRFLPLFPFPPRIERSRPLIRGLQAISRASAQPALEIPRPSDSRASIRGGVFRSPSEPPRIRAGGGELRDSPFPVARPPPSPSRLRGMSARTVHGPSPCLSAPERRRRCPRQGSGHLRSQFGAARFTLCHPFLNPPTQSSPVDRISHRGCACPHGPRLRCNGLRAAVLPSRPPHRPESHARIDAQLFMFSTCSLGAQAAGGLPAKP
jgi:hypothetical protein